MRRTNIYLEDEKLDVLKHLAAMQGGTSVSDLIRQAIDQFLGRKLAEDAPWGERLDQLLERVRAKIPPGVTPEKIEADISEARAEARRERARRR